MAKHQGKNSTYSCEFTIDSGTFTAVAQIKSIKPPAMSFSTEDTTTLSDSATAKSGGILDSGTISVELFYDPTDSSHVSLKTAFETGSTYSHKIYFGASGSEKTWAFDGHFTKFELSPLERSAYQMLSIEVDVTGLVSVT